MKNIFLICIILFCISGCNFNADNPAKFKIGDVVKYKAFPGSKCYITENPVFKWDFEPSKNTWYYKLKCNSNINSNQFSGVEIVKLFEWEIEPY